MFVKSLIRIAVISICFLEWGCLDVDFINIYLFPEKNNVYSGMAKIEFFNIHSTAESAEKKEQEMNELFRDYKSDAENIVQSMSLINHTVELHNRKKMSTDALIQGSFKNILATLGMLTESKYRFEGNKNRLSVYWKNPLTDNDNINLIIQFSGKIVSHNSKHFDSKTGTMKWNMSKIGDKEIRFVLESE